MATVIARKRADGMAAFSVQISIMKDGRIVHRESKTFSDKAMAKAWGERRERDLAKPGGIEAAKIGKETLADAITKYVTTSKKEIGRTKAQVLETIKGMDIARKRCSEIGPTDIVNLAQELHDGGRQPSTVMNYVSHLGAVFAVAKPAWRFELDPEAMVGAQAVCKRLGLTSKSKHRDRRPILNELDKLMVHFGNVETRRTGNLPMQRVVCFAIFSTRRQDEITRIAWKDLEPGRVLVRDMKHPGDKAGQ